MRTSHGLAALLIAAACGSYAVATFPTIVGARSDETCCRACGVGGWETPVITLQGFKVYDCAGQCDEDTD